VVREQKLDPCPSAAHSLQTVGLSDRGPNPPQRMAGRYALADRHVAELGSAAGEVTSHLIWAEQMAYARRGDWIFEQTLKLSHSFLFITHILSACSLIN